MRFVFLLALAFGGCSLIDGPEPSASNVRFSTDQSAYVAERFQGEPIPRFRFAVVARFENASGRAIYLTRCDANTSTPSFGVVLDDPADDEGAAYDEVWVCAGYGQPIVVSAGASRVDTIWVSGPNAFISGTRRHYGILEGTFRLYYDARTCSEGVGCELDDSISVSTPFVVSLRNTHNELVPQ